MKIKTHIARILRRCGYAVALTMATGSIASSAHEITIEYQTDAIPQQVVDEAHQYTLNVDLAKPTIPQGTIVWDTKYITELYAQGNCAVRSWAPFRRADTGGSANWDYGVITPYAGGHYVQGVTNSSVTVVKDALRAKIQAEVNRKLISYVGAASLRPWTGERGPLSNVYKHEEGIQFYTKDGKGKLTLKTTVKPVYDETGTLVYHCDDNKPTTLYDADGNELTPISEEIYAARVGDDRSQGRSYIISTPEKINVHDNMLLIDHSGFGLAAAGYSQYGDVFNNLVYIHDVRCSDDIMAAGTSRGEAYYNTVILARSEAIGHNVTQAAKEAGAYLGKYNNSGKVVGAWVGGKQENHAYYNTVFVYGSSVYQDVTGAMGGGDMHHNSVYINRSQISIGLHDVEPSRGGYSYYNKAHNNLIVIDDTFDAVKAGIIEEDLSYYSSTGTAQTSTVPPVTTLHDDLIGATAEASYGEDAAQFNRVIIKGITTYDKASGKEVTTTVQGNIFGGVASNSFGSTSVPGVAGSATNNIVSISGANILRDVTVSVLTDPLTNAWTPQQLSINVGCITGGFSGAPYNLRWTPGNANNNVVIVRDSYYENSIYGGRNSAWWCNSITDSEGKEIGNGHASNNVVVLENLRTPVLADKSQNDVSSHDTTVYGGWAEYGKTNNNQVFISGTNNTMDNTMLHGGWGHRFKSDGSGFLGKDGSLLLPDAHYFDGTNFYSESGLVVGTFRRAELINDKSGTIIISDISGFDGRAFYDADGNDAHALSSTSLAVWKSDSKHWADYIRYSREIKGTVDADGNLVSCEFYVEGSTASVASFNNDSIVNSEGKTLLSGIAKTELLAPLSADGKVTRARFYDKEGNLIGTIGTFLTSRSYGPLKNEPPYHVVTAENGTPVAFTGTIRENADGSITLQGEDPTVTYTFINSAILDAQDNVIAELDTNIHIYKDGTVLRMPGNAADLFATLDGYDEYDTYTRDNWLHIDGFQGKIEGFDHFEKLHFIFTDEINLVEPMVMLTGDQSTPGSETSSHLLITPEPGATPVAAKVTADISAIADDLRPGDIVPVIGDENHEKIEGIGLVPRDSVVDDDTIYQQGVTRTVKLETEFFEVDNQDDDASNDASTLFENYGVIKVLNRTDEVTPESKSLLEGRIATLTLNNMGGNLVAEQGIDNACRGLDDAGNPADANHFIAVDQNAKGAVTYVPKAELKPGNRLFFAMSGAHSKVDSGSDVDVDGTNALVGISRGFMEKNALVLGAFMETGWGKYHTHNNFGVGANVPFVRGSGETSYVGAGALLRYHLRNLGRRLEGVSVDASVRAGRQETDYATADLADNYGAFAAYEQESDYLAGHVGVNYSFQPKDKLTALLYARYLWTHVSADKAVVCGETVDFDSMSSNRIRLGGRMSWQAAEKWTPYAGAAYEWECSGTSHAATHGMGITAPSMRGGSVIGEVGVIWQPNMARALWVEGALQGSVGKNEHYGAKVGVSIGF